MKKEALFFTAGIASALCITALAAQVDLNPNAFPITLNGTPVEIEGYNIDGSTYFKLRDIGEKTGFDVSFENDTIVIKTQQTPPKKPEGISSVPGMPEQLPEGEGATPEEALAELKERLAKKVEAGEITQTEADEIIAQFGTAAPASTATPEA